MKKHKHLFKKVSDGLEMRKNMFQGLVDKDLGKHKTQVTRFKCSCGEEQVFEDVPGGEWNKSLPNEFVIE